MREIYVFYRQVKIIRYAAREILYANDKILD